MKICIIKYNLKFKKIIKIILKNNLENLKMKIIDLNI